MNSNKSLAKECIRLLLWAMKGTTELREKPLLARDKNTLHAKQRPPKLTRSCGCIFDPETSQSYRTIYSKIISGILTMVYSAVNHSYDSKRTIKIISGRHNMAFITIQNTLSKFWLSDNIFTSTVSNWTKLNWSPELWQLPMWINALVKDNFVILTSAKGRVSTNIQYRGPREKTKKHETLIWKLQ